MDLPFPAAPSTSRAAATPYRNWHNNDPSELPAHLAAGHRCYLQVCRSGCHLSAWTLACKNTCSCPPRWCTRAHSPRCCPGIRLCLKVNGLPSLNVIHCSRAVFIPFFPRYWLCLAGDLYSAFSLLGLIEINRLSQNTSFFKFYVKEKL